MECPICHNAMTHSSAGWLCMNCGHVEASTGSVPATSTPPARNGIDPITPPAPVMPVAPMAPTTPNEPIQPMPQPTPPPVVVPPAFAPAPAPATSTPLQPVTQPKSRRKLLVIGIPAAIILILAAVGFYGWWWQPHMALSSYLNRLVSAKTAAFNGSTVVASSNPSSTLTIKMSGHYDVASQADPKIDISLNGSSQTQGGPSVLGNSSIGGEVIFTNQTAYLKITDLSLLSSLINVSIKPDWYKYPLPSDQQTNKCVSSDKKSGQLFGSTIVTNMPLTKVHRVGLFQTIDGHSTSHYSGVVDTAKLPAAITAANRNLSSACKITLSPSDYKNLNLSYDLWDGSSFDRMVLTVNDKSSNTKTTITLDTSAYNKPVNITAPSGAKDINQLINDLVSGTPTASSAGSTDSTITTQ